MTNTIATHINCPECNTSINIKEAIAKNYQNELSKEERLKIRTEEKNKLENQYKETMEAKDIEIEEQITKIVEYNTLKENIKHFTTVIIMFVSRKHLFNIWNTWNIIYKS